MPEFEDPIKQVCWQTYWEGFKRGRCVESYDAFTRRCAIKSFERWWELNVE